MAQKEKSIKVKIDKKAIEKKAYYLSKLNYSYDVLAWLLAEAELRLLLAIRTKIESDTETVEIDPTLLADHPNENNIREVAKKIAKNGLTIQELHWFLAERQFIYENIKEKKI